MFFDPNFQLVLSKAKRYGGLSGKSRKINRATKSVSKAYFAINLWILRREDSVFTLPSKAIANFSKPTV